MRQDFTHLTGAVWLLHNPNCLIRAPGKAKRLRRLQTFITTFIESYNFVQEKKNQVPLTGLIKNYTTEVSIYFTAH